MAVGVGIAGFDHWYAAIGACDEAARESRCRLVAAAGGQPQVADFARQRSIPFVSQDPLEVVARPDVDLVVAAASSDRNPALVAEAAARGKAFISVKPMAVTAAAGEQIAAAVRRAGIPFFPLESQGRLRTQAQRVREWWGAGGRTGRPVSALTVMRGSVPLEDWPGHRVPSTWWCDPMRVPGGGWIDHSIYDIDLLRYALDAEVATVFGRTSNIKHPELRVEDFGVATLTFTNGVIAVVEVTWHGTPGAGAGTRQFVGTEGQIIAGLPGSRGWLVARQDSDGWQPEEVPSGGSSALSHMIDHLLDGKALAVDVQAGLANLRACLAFYRSAAEGRAVAPSDV